MKFEMTFRGGTFAELMYAYHQERQLRDPLYKLQVAAAWGTPKTPIKE